MNSLTIPWSPSSFQLRLALRCREFSFSPLLLRVRFQNPNHRPFRIYSVADDGPKTSDNNGEATATAGATDVFAGWSDSDQSDASNWNQSLAGTVGAGLAGIFFVAGLTFAALSIGKKSTSRVQQQLEPLTLHQEVSLASDDRDEQFEQKNEGIHNAHDTSSQKSKTGIDKDSLLYLDNKEIGFGDDNDVGHTSYGDVTNGPTIQQNSQHETAKLGASADSEATSKSPRPESGGYSIVAPSVGNSDGTSPESKVGSFADGTPESVFASDNPDFVVESGTSHSIIDTNMTNHAVFHVDTANLSSEHQQAVSGLQETDYPNPSLSSFPKESNSSNFQAIESQSMHAEESSSVKGINEQSVDMPVELNNSSTGTPYFDKKASTGSDMISPTPYTLTNEQGDNLHTEANVSGMSFDSTNPEFFVMSAGVPAPSLVSAALQSHPGKVLVPAVVDPVQGQALAALQVLKVIEAEIQPGDLCTRREYARWLVSASSALSRNTMSKVYPAMYIENATELAFDDITPEDPDFPSIQGLAEAGLISSKLSRHDMQSDDEHNPLYFSPECPLSRQDLVCWKMAIERRQLPVVNRKSIERLSGFIDTDKIHPDAWPAIAADLATGEQGIIALAFGYTRLFQPDKPVTNAQAAVALATGEASDIVNEELARIEAESMAEKAVAAHSELVAQVDKEINARFEKDLILEREKIDAVEKLTEETRQELERLKAQQEEENFALMRERAAVDSEMEVLSKLRREVEEQLQTTMSNKVAISYEKERLNKLREDADTENREIPRLQNELEVERKALSMARAWAEDEAKRAREQAKALEEARGRWESQGIKVIVDDDLREEANAGATWLSAGKELSVEGTVNRAENLVDELRNMAGVVKGRSKQTIDMIIQKIIYVVSVLKELALKISSQAGEAKDAVVSKTSSSFKEVQQSSAEFSSTAKEGIKRIAIDCKDGLGKFTQKFKT